jgi:hypothetical protein
MSGVSPVVKWINDNSNQQLVSVSVERKAQPLGRWATNNSHVDSRSRCGNVVARIDSLVTAYYNEHELSGALLRLRTPQRER